MNNSTELMVTSASVAKAQPRITKIPETGPFSGLSKLATIPAGWSAILAMKASPKPLRVFWKAPPVIGKSAELVLPMT
jgi:hypothetical protein